MKTEKIVMVNIGPKAWLPVHVLALDFNDATGRALQGLSAAGIDYETAPTIIVDFHQDPTNMQFRKLAEADRSYGA